jgi:hypothetical protein
MRLHDVKVEKCAPIVGPDSTCIWHQFEDTAAFWEATLADCMHGRQSEALMAGSGVTADDCPAAASGRTSSPHGDA